ncbi:MAG: hypothetical protein ACKO0U_10015 [Gammaproteobacteria bacterium]
MPQSVESLRKKALEDAARRRAALRWRLLVLGVLLAGLWWVQPRVGPAVEGTLELVTGRDAAP